MDTKGNPQGYEIRNDDTRHRVSKIFFDKYTKRWWQWFYMACKITKDLIMKIIEAYDAVKYYKMAIENTYDAMQREINNNQFFINFRDEQKAKNRKVMFYDLKFLVYTKNVDGDIIDCFYADIDKDKRYEIHFVNRYDGDMEDAFELKGIINRNFL